MLARFSKLEGCRLGMRQVTVLNSMSIRAYFRAQVLSIKDADFSWTSTAVQPTLEGINLSVRKGDLVGVYGKVCGFQLRISLFHIVNLVL